MNERFTSLPSTEEMLEVVGRRSAPKSRSKPGRMARMLRWASLIFLVGIVVCTAMNIQLPETAKILALVSWALYLVIWIGELVADMIRNRDIMLNPAGVIARQLDAQYLQEVELVERLDLIPLSVIDARLGRVEAQLAALEKWIDVTRLFWLIGPAAVLLAKVGPLQLPATGQELVQAVAAALVIGTAAGAVSMRSGIRKLQRIACVLKMALDKAKLRPTVRRTGPVRRRIR
ncbi:MAG TPA: hypothetical protein VFG03_00410 [Telluria sp.]|nr:hypothetical protein [Telluria sp.]